VGKRELESFLRNGWWFACDKNCLDGLNLLPDELVLDSQPWYDKECRKEKNLQTRENIKKGLEEQID
jgi:hypothetical protein